MEVLVLQRGQGLRQLVLRDLAVGVEQEVEFLRDLAQLVLDDGERQAWKKTVLDFGHCS